MAQLVAVRHKSQADTEDPGLMGREHFERFGKDKGYVEVTDEAARAAAIIASGGTPDVGDGLDGKTVDELKALVPDGVTPASQRKADLIAAIRQARA